MTYFLKEKINIWMMSIYTKGIYMKLKFLEEGNKTTSPPQKFVPLCEPPSIWGLQYFGTKKKWTYKTGSIHMKFSIT